ncbi:hypothetical protein [Flavobacterium sp.]|uniref:hypothetical protein n=1 Tax=Flavobacterium sp. TaxID=239 RepID=UPI001B45579F|nr:hypothetical protein [Flavobacterium sp.]MBP6127407.1 hypothetical protein [Flavobacterium sp.]
MIRHFEVVNPELPILDANGLIEDKYLFSPSDKLGDMSTSLLSIFTYVDISVALTKWGGKEFGMYCDNDFSTLIPRYLDHFYFTNDRDFWCINIGMINDEPLTYLHTDGDIENTFHCKIIHTPAKWNFWHFSIRWLFNDGRYFFELHKDGKVSKGNLKRISNSVRVLLKKHAKNEKVDFKLLLEENYLK